MIDCDGDAPAPEEAEDETEESEESEEDSEDEMPEGYQMGWYGPVRCEE